MTETNVLNPINIMKWKLNLLAVGLSLAAVSVGFAQSLIRHCHIGGRLRRF
jgi:hypothetical protein